MVAPLLLAGVFPLKDPVNATWGVSGAWLYPVGARRALGTDSPECPAFKLNRGLEQSGQRLTHEGADMANGRGGDTVRAAGSGLVVLNASRDDGYGRRIVMAHRCADGAVRYTVYAHLSEGTTVVHAGDRVCAGDPLARVGQTGRASTPHLHFEVRETSAPGERWEHARVLDPIAFLDARLPQALDAESGVAPYLEWAQCEGLIDSHAAAEGVLTRASWWRMVMAAAAIPAQSPPVEDEALRDSLITQGLLPQDAGDEGPLESLTWKDCARDLQRLADVGVRMAHGPLFEDAHDALCHQRFDRTAPASDAGGLRKRHGVPRTADACVLLADLSGPRAEQDLPVAGRGAKHGGKHAPKHHGGRGPKHRHHHLPKRQSLKHPKAGKHAHA